MSIGRQAEQYVVSRLRLRGWSILATNFTRRGIEVDIIAQLGHEIVAFEIKYRRKNSSMYQGLWDQDKYQRICRGLLIFLGENNLSPQSLRVDLVLLTKKRSQTGSFEIYDYWRDI